MKDETMNDYQYGRELAGFVLEAGGGGAYDDDGKINEEFISRWRGWLRRSSPTHLACAMFALSQQVRGQISPLDRSVHNVNLLVDVVWYATEGIKTRCLGVVDGFNSALPAGSEHADDAANANAKFAKGIIDALFGKA